MASNSLHLLLTALLASSLLLSFIDPSITRTVPSGEDAFQVNEGENERDNAGKTGNELFRSRMDLEINRDYPGSGANNRHTPSAPVKD